MRSDVKGAIKKIIIVILSTILLALAGSAAYIYILLEQIPRTPIEDVILLEEGSAEPGNATNGIGLDRSELPDEQPGGPADIPHAEERTAPKIRQDADIINILVLGVDRRQGERRGRSDTIMIATADNERRELKLTSLMRDMYLPIPGRGDNRLNAAYAFGGPGLAIRTVNENFALGIERYVVVDFLAFEKIVDMVGGISINIKSSEANELGIQNSGVQTLNGKQALAYTRIRNVGRDDFDRVHRQQVLLSKLLEKIRGIGILRIPGLISAVLPHVETNISNFEILRMGTSVLGFMNEEVYRFRLPVDGTFTSATVSGMMVLVPDIGENTRRLHDFLYSGH